MKTINNTILFFLLLILASCDKETLNMTTVLNSDGSCSRSVMFKCDSLTMAGEKTERKHIVDVLDNEAWQKSWESYTDSTKAETSYLCTATRDFDNVSEMNDNYPIEIYNTRIIKQSNYEKHFCGFYSDVTYSETFVDFSKEFAVPGSLFFSEDELSYWLTGEPNILQGKSGYESMSEIDRLESTMNLWQTANHIHDMLTAIADNYDSFDNCPVSRDDILLKRDSLLSNDFYCNKSWDIIGNDNNIDITDVEKAIIGTDYFHKGNVNERLNSLCSSLEERYGAIGLDDIAYTLVVPGTVISVGNGVLTGNNVIEYKVSGVRMLKPDYTICATYRIINWWFVVIASLIVLTPICIAVYTRRKK